MTAVSPDLKTITFVKSGLNYTNSSLSLSGVSFRLKVQNIFVFTDEDVVNLSDDVSVGGASLTKNTDYYVVESDGISKFKLSTTLGGSAISITGSATATPKVDVGAVGKSIADSAMFSDATLTVLSNKNNPIVEVRFSNMYPVSLGALEFNQQATDVEYMTVSADFTYQIYEIHAL